MFGSDTGVCIDCKKMFNKFEPWAKLCGSCEQEIKDRDRTNNE